jgi:hypothetical protein
MNSFNSVIENPLIENITYKGIKAEKKLKSHTNLKLKSRSSYNEFD